MKFHQFAAEACQLNTNGKKLDFSSVEMSQYFDGLFQNLKKTGVPGWALAYLMSVNFLLKSAMEHDSIRFFHDDAAAARACLEFGQVLDISDEDFGDDLDIFRHPINGGIIHLSVKSAVGQPVGVPEAGHVTFILSSSFEKANLWAREALSRGKHVFILTRLKSDEIEQQQKLMADYDTGGVLLWQNMDYGGESHVLTAYAVGGNRYEV